MKRILCFSGSTRAGSTCMALIEAIAERHKNQADFVMYGGLQSLPHFDPNAEDSDLPVAVLELRAAVASSDAVLFCTPEYVFSVPAILKNAIEWCVASTVFSEKPTAMIVASGAGANTFESLALILKTIQCRISAATMLHLPGVRAKMLTGDLSDASVLKKLDKLFAALNTQRHPKDISA